MAAKALVQTRIDADVKQQATVVLENMGLTVSDAERAAIPECEQYRRLAGFMLHRLRRTLSEPDHPDAYPELSSILHKAPLTQRSQRTS